MNGWIGIPGRGRKKVVIIPIVLFVGGGDSAWPATAKYIHDVFIVVIVVMSIAIVVAGSIDLNRVENPTVCQSGASQRSFCIQSLLAV
jgi:hypothetical protein